MNSEKENQSKQILRALRKRENFTALEALQRFGSLSFAKRISEISQMLDKSEMIKKEWEYTNTGKRVIRYSLVPIVEESKNDKVVWSNPTM